MIKEIIIIIIIVIAGRRIREVSITAVGAYQTVPRLKDQTELNVIMDVFSLRGGGGGGGPRS